MLPLSIAWQADGRRPVGTRVVPVLHAATLAATGSRGAWLGAVVGVAIFSVGRPTTRVAWAPAAALLATVTAGVLLAPTRAIADTLRGRLHIWTTAAPHALDHPLVGAGPGSFATRYPAWEAERIATGVLDPASRGYVAAQRHAHNDYLEFFVELGVPGLVIFPALLAAAIAWGLRHSEGSVQDLRAAAVAGLAALGAIALVDFPFQRPVESVTWWTLLAMTVLTGEPAARRHA
jgi:O-antigen ligase